MAAESGILWKTGPIVIRWVTTAPAVRISPLWERRPRRENPSQTTKNQSEGGSPKNCGLPDVITQYPRINRGQSPHRLGIGKGRVF